MYQQRYGNKFGAKRTEYNGRHYDSKYEAGVAGELDLRLKAGDIKAIDPQYRVGVWCYRENGLKAFKVSHKVDFRVTNNDDSYTLVEAKGVETPDYKWRRKFLEEIFLPDNPDYTYEVVMQRSGWR